MVSVNRKTAATSVRGAFASILAIILVCSVTQAASAMPTAPTSAQIASPWAKKPHYDALRHHCVCSRPVVRVPETGSEASFAPNYESPEEGCVDRGLEGPAISANGEVHFPYTLSR